MSFVYSPGNPLVPDSAEAGAATKTETVAQKTDVAPDVQPEVIKQPSLAEQIRAERAEREARGKRDAEEQSAKKQVEDLQTKVQKFERGKENILLDSVSFLRELGLSDKEIALVAENTMYGLVPDKAPADFRAKAIEAQYNRDKQLAADREAKAKVEAEEKAKKLTSEAGERMELEYRESLYESIPSLTGNTVSVEWFGKDHADYAESLFHTARNLAAEATRAGKRADLSPANVAAVLEKHMADKVGRIGGTKQVAVPAEVSKQVEAKVAPTTPVKPAGTVIAKDKKALPTEEERLARAAAVAWK